MVKPYDIHTHTVFCDGADRPEAMAKAASRLGFGCLGFSGHEYTEFDSSYCMSVDGTKAYKKEISRLKKVFAGELTVLCGIERDFFSERTGDYDYVIGSVHYLDAGGERFPIDLSVSDFKKNIELYYGGDYSAAVRDYYSYVTKLPEKTGCGIIGHFDLISKYNGGGALFDAECNVCRNAALSAAEALIETGSVFEVNTGAVTRGLKNEPYPARFIMCRLAEKNAPIILSGDTHSAAELNLGWRTAVLYALSCGFKTALYPEADGFTEFSLYGAFVSV